MINRLRRSFRESFRLKKKDRLPESSKPHQWIDDEKSVRNGDCHFSVKYLGHVEVSDARGMQVCEEAMNILRSSRRKPIKSQLHVTGDGLRVVDDEKRGLIVDQTIEKVSFCAPDRQHEKGFSYICRDGATRRWVLHGFHAVKDSGERLSHAVGCAFAICLEKKQKRDRDLELARSSSSASQQATGSNQSSTAPFQRNSSFRQSSIRERMKDPQGVKPEVSKPPSKPVVNPYAIERPHATPQLLERQGSFRAFTGLSSASPFKRQLSLRLNELPSNLERQGRFSSHATASISNNNNSNDDSKSHNGYSRNEEVDYKFATHGIKSNMFSTPPSTTFSPPDKSLSSFSRTLNGDQTNVPLFNGNSSNSDEKGDLASQYISSIADMCKELTQGLALLSHDDSDDLKNHYPPLKDPSSSLTDSSDSHYISAFDNCEEDTKKNAFNDGTNLWPAHLSNNNDAIGYGLDKSRSHFSCPKGDFISPNVTASINSTCLPTATVAPLMSPVVVSTLSSSNTRDTPPIKKQFAPKSGRTSTLDSPSIPSNGLQIVRRPVPPPPVSDESPARGINQCAPAIPTSATFRPSLSSSNALDLSKVWPASLSDPFDAEWTNLVTKNISLSGKPLPLQKNNQKNLITPHDTIKTQSDSSTQLPSSLPYSLLNVTPSNGFSSQNFDSKPLPVDAGFSVSTNPFTCIDSSNQTSSIRKEFQIDM